MTSCTEQLSEKYAQADADKETIARQNAQIEDLTAQLEKLAEQKELFDRVEENIDQILEEVRAEAEQIKAKACEEAEKIRRDGSRSVARNSSENRQKKTESILDRIRKFKNSLKED